MLYMVTFTINIPPMLAYIPYMDPMGMFFLTSHLYFPCLRPEERQAQADAAARRAGNADAGEAEPDVAGEQVEARVHKWGRRRMPCKMSMFSICSVYYVPYDELMDSWTYNLGYDGIYNYWDINSMIWVYISQYRASFAGSMLINHGMKCGLYFGIVRWKVCRNWGTKIDTQFVIFRI